MFNFSPLTVLVGTNGSGKSNVIDALRFVSDALQVGLDAAVVKRHGMSAVRRWSAKGRPFDVELNVFLRVEEQMFLYRFTMASAQRGEYRVKQESLSALSAPGVEGAALLFGVEDDQWMKTPDGVHPAIPSKALGLPLLAGVHPFREVYGALTNISFYNILPNQLTEPQKPANPYPLEERGENLASVLRDLRRNRPENAQRLEDALGLVMGDVDSYQVSQVGGYLVTRLGHTIKESGRSPAFELSQESDGTLRMLGLLTALYQDPPRTLIALEEPELTIHPGAIALLWDQIVKASERSQVLITTHSPDLLDMCTAEQIRVVEKQNGQTVVGPVADDQKAVIQQRLFAPGQLLQAQGLRRAEARGDAAPSTNGAPKYGAE